MVPAIVLALREGMEAALLIGIAFGVLRRLGRPDLGRAVWAGAASAAGVSALVAVVLNLLDTEFSGTGEQIFEGLSMLLAAGILTWMIFWMKSQAASQGKSLEGQIQRAVEKQGGTALFLVTFLAVVREGVELALYLLAARLATDPLGTLAGSLLGLAAAGLLGWIVYTGSRRMSLRQFFKITNVFLLIFAAGLVGLAVAELNEAGIVPALVEHIWNLGTFLPDDAGLGQILRALVGYNASPSLSAALIYAVYLGSLASILFRPRPPLPINISHES